MEELVKVMILSHKRAGKVETLKTVKNCSICVPESQAAEYREYNPGVEIIAHPDNVVGISPKIRWVYDKFRNVIMMDDDLSMMCRAYADKEFPLKQRVDAETAYEIIQASAYMCKEIGAHFFGFSNMPRPIGMATFAPFKFTGFVQGGSMGFLDGFKMVLPDNCGAPDYFLSGINAYYHRKAWIDLRYYFASKEGTFRSTGGMAEFRSNESERNDYIMLKKYFGPAIERKGKTGVKSMQSRYERSLIIDF